MNETLRPKIGRNPFAQPAVLWQVDFSVPAAIVPQVEQAFDGFSLSVSSFEEDDAGTVWSVQVLMDSRPKPEEIRQRLAHMGLNGATPPAPQITKVEPENWQLALERDFPPRVIGRFFVHGAHARKQRPVHAIPLQLEAGMAFGSGEHATTSGCLLAIERIAKRRKCVRVLDMGCGSGILAIAAAKCFRQAKVLAVDVDRVAVQVARRNIRVNRVADKVRAMAGDGYKAAAVRGQYDVILANILARPLTRMARPLATHLAPGGMAVLSGLLAPQETMVIAAHRAQGLKLAARITRDGWTTLVMCK